MEDVTRGLVGWGRKRGGTDKSPWAARGLSVGGQRPLAGGWPLGSCPAPLSDWGGGSGGGEE